MRGARGSSYSKHQWSDHSSMPGIGGGSDNQYNQPPGRVTRRKRTWFQSFNPSAPKCHRGGTRPEHSSASSTGHRELITATNHHIADDINVPQSNGDKISIGITNYQLGEERFPKVTSRKTCQETRKSLNMSLEGQLSQEANDKNIIPSFVEVPGTNDGHLDYIWKSHFVNATTKELRLSPMNPCLAPTLQAIISKYGDIARDCLLESTSARTFMLEGVCRVVQELSNKKLEELDGNSLYDYDSFLKDAEAMKFNVKWLQLRLDEIHDGVKSLVETKAATDEKTELTKRIDYLKKNLQMEKAKPESFKSLIEEQEVELALNTLDAKTLSYKISNLATGYQRFQRKSLIDGLL